MIPFAAPRAGRCRRLWLATAVLWMVACSAARAAEHTTHELWWRSPAVRAQIGLNAAQVQQIDELYRQSVPGRKILRTQLQRSQERLSRALTDGVQNDRKTRRLIEAVVDAERRSNVARTMVLVRIYAILTPQQRVSLERVSPWSDAFSRSGSIGAKPTTRAPR